MAVLAGGPGVGAHVPPAAARGARGLTQHAAGAGVVSARLVHSLGINVRTGLNNTSQDRRWDPKLVGLWANGDGPEPATTMLAELRLPGRAVTDYGAPVTAWLELSVANNTRGVHGQQRAGRARRLSVKLSLLGKRGTRLPEAFWVGFDPSAQGEGEGDLEWRMDKMGRPFVFGETASERAVKTPNGGHFS